VLRAWMPGITPDQVRVALHRDRLTIWTTALTPVGNRPGTLCHSVRLPNPVNIAHATMDYRDGELTVILPHSRGRIRLPGEATEAPAPRAQHSQHARREPPRQAAAALVS
jgi:HSP20 family molecular chaperone IbpA